MTPEEHALLISNSVRLAKIESLLMYAMPVLVASTQKTSLGQKAAGAVFAEDHAQISRCAIELLSEEFPQFRKEFFAAAKEQSELAKTAYIDLRIKYGLE